MTAKVIASAILACCSVGSFAGNFATCIIDNMPGMQSDPAAYATVRLCLDRYPGGFDSIEQGSGRWLMGYKSGAECASKKAADTRSNIAAGRIYVACKRLYDEPVPLDLVFDPLPSKR